MGYQECKDPQSIFYGQCDGSIPSSNREVEIDESEVTPPDSVVDYEIRETVEIIGWVTPLPTQAEVALATTTAAVTATTAVIATTMVQQLLKVLQPVFKFVFMKAKNKFFPKKD